MKTDIRYDYTSLTTTALRFEEFPDLLRDDLIDEINALAGEAFADVAARVPRRTGRLASEEQIVTKNEPNVVSATVNFDGGGAVGNDFAKAGALEYGSTGKPFDVKGYSQSRTSVFGRRLSAPHDAVVKAYERPGRIVEDAFTRPVAAQMQAAAIDRLNAVAERAAARFNAE